MLDIIGHKSLGQLCFPQPSVATIYDGLGNRDEALSDCELAVRVARLWPNIEHEANSMMGLLCRVGRHRWRRLDLATLMPDKDIVHCFWCSKVKIDGVVYNP